METTSSGVKKQKPTMLKLCETKQGSLKLIQEWESVKSDWEAVTVTSGGSWVIAALLFVQ